MALSWDHSWWRSNMVTFKLFWLKPTVKKKERKRIFYHNLVLSIHTDTDIHTDTTDTWQSFKGTLTLYYRWCLPSSFHSPFLSEVLLDLLAIIGVFAGRHVVQLGSRQGQNPVRGLLFHFWTLNRTTSILISLTQGKQLHLLVYY